MATVSRLWKKLGLTEPMVHVWSEDGLEISDHNLTSIKISRGSSTAEAGIVPQTLEVATTFALASRADYRVHCDLTDSATARLYQYTRARPDYTKQRFYGRVGKMSLQDITYPRNQITTLTAASWEAQLKNIGTRWNFGKNTPVSSILQSLATPTGIGMPPLPPQITPADNTLYGYLADTMSDATYSDAIAAVAEDTNLFGKVMRDGAIYWQPNEYRNAQALQALENTMPITRSQAISPATWEQPSESVKATHRVKWYNGDIYREYSFGESVNNPNIAVVEHDMSKVTWPTNENQPMTSGAAFLERDSSDSWRIPSLTVDLLRLITSSTQSHRDQARQLLEMNAGDPVFLSGDWFGQLQGIHYAIGIDESITPDGWDLTLNLAPSKQVTGYDSPVIPPRTWESAGGRWTDRNTRWNP